MLQKGEILNNVMYITGMPRKSLIRAFAREGAYLLGSPSRST